MLSFFFSSRRRHTRCALVTGVQTCALPISLVLINGRRAGPAGIRGAVAPFDLNVLPLSVVRQVEILKTGASSIYGSDAVAGVVNILTRDDLDGFEGGGFSSITEQDRKSTRLNSSH